MAGFFRKRVSNDSSNQRVQSDSRASPSPPASPSFLRFSSSNSNGPVGQQASSSPSVRPVSGPMALGSTTRRPSTGARAHEVSERMMATGWRSDRQPDANGRQPKWNTPKALIDLTTDPKSFQGPTPNPVISVQDQSDWLPKDFVVPDLQAIRADSPPIRASIESGRVLPSPSLPTPSLALLTRIEYRKEKPLPTPLLDQTESHSEDSESPNNLSSPPSVGAQHLRLIETRPDDGPGLTSGHIRQAAQFSPLPSEQASKIGQDQVPQSLRRTNPTEHQATPGIRPPPTSQSAPIHPDPRKLSPTSPIHTKGATKAEPSKPSKSLLRLSKQFLSSRRETRSNQSASSPQEHVPPGMTTSAPVMVSDLGSSPGPHNSMGPFGGASMLSSTHYLSSPENTYDASSAMNTKEPDYRHAKEPAMIGSSRRLSPTRDDTHTAQPAGSMGAHFQRSVADQSSAAQDSQRNRSLTPVSGGPSPSQSRATSQIIITSNGSASSLATHSLHSHATSGASSAPRGLQGELSGGSLPTSLASDNDRGDDGRQPSSAPSRSASVRSISQTPAGAAVRSKPLIFATMAPVDESPPRQNVAPKPTPIDARPDRKVLTLDTRPPPAPDPVPRSWSASPSSRHQSLLNTPQAPSPARKFGGSFDALLVPSAVIDSPTIGNGSATQLPTVTQSQALGKSSAFGPSTEAAPHTRPTSYLLHRPVSHGAGSGQRGAAPHANTPSGPRILSKTKTVSPVSPPTLTSPLEKEDLPSPPGLPLDDDPFARVEPVRVVRTSQTPEARRPVSRDEFFKKASGKEKRPKPGAGEIGSVDQVDRATHGSLQDRDVHDKKSAKRRVPVPSEAPKTLLDCLCNPLVLARLLSYFSFLDWCKLFSLNKPIRTLLVKSRALREEVLEWFLGTVGYARWSFPEAEPLSLSLMDLNAYMRAVSMPIYQYSRIAEMWLQSKNTESPDPKLQDTIQNLITSTRAYTRVVLRLRAQADAQAIHATAPENTRSNSTSPIPTRVTELGPPPARDNASNVPPHRVPSPSPSLFSHSHHGHQHRAPGMGRNAPFHSPLYRTRRAPVLYVFVPSPDGDWLSDASVLECEAELRRAGVVGMLRIGDVVWDVAVGDEGNIGRMIWDGSYLLDLDFTYSAIGDVPKYLHALAFPPSYFHRVIRTGNSSTNPIVRIDISPWGEEIVANLQLLQDRVRTETPQGTQHNVVRWVHRSSFAIQPRRNPRHSYQSGHRSRPPSERIPLPGTDGQFIDPGWYGTVVVETEGTNEGLADLRTRCGLGALPGGHGAPRVDEGKLVFRVLRERSRPGEIWIRAVYEKEKIQ